jgi:hypothetical protein
MDDFAAAPAYRVGHIAALVFSSLPIGELTSLFGESAEVPWQRAQREHLSWTCPF